MKRRPFPVAGVLAAVCGLMIDAAAWAQTSGDDILAGAADRIEQHRKADAVVAVVEVVP